MITHQNKPYIVLSCKENQLSQTHDQIKIMVNEKDPNAPSVTYNFYEEDKSDRKKSVVEFWVRELSKQLRMRGFKIEKSIHNDGSHIFLLSILPKRYQLLDLNRNSYGISFLTPPERFRLAQDSLEILNRLISIDMGLTVQVASSSDETFKNITFKWIAWIAHDFDELKKVQSSNPNSIRDYYGNKIAIYFAFLKYYSNCLILFAIFGSLVFSHQVAISSSKEFSFFNSFEYLSTINADSAFTPWLGLAQAIWGTCFLAFWKLNENKLLVNWNALGDEIKLNSKINIKDGIPDAQINRSGSNNWRVFTSILIVVGVLYLMIRVILLSYEWEQAIENMDKKDLSVIPFWLISYSPLIFRSVFPILFSPIFECIVTLTDWLESHTDLAKRDNFIIYKKFAFQFVANYCSLFYIAFFKQNLSELRLSLISILTISACINNLIESSLFKCISQKRAYLGLKQNEADEEADRLLKLEASYVSNNIDDEFLEMAIQFGFITMFAVAFPLAPLFALVNNFLEGGVDLLKLRSGRRYGMQINRNRIGPWQHCFEFTSFFSVITNIFLLCYCSKYMESYILSHFKYSVENLGLSKVIIMVVIEHVILGFKYLLQKTIDVDAVQVAYYRDRANSSNNASDYGGDTPPTQASGLSTKPRRRSSKFATSPGSKQGENYFPSNNSGAAASTSSDCAMSIRKHSEDAIPFSKDPMFFISAFMIAPLLHSMNISMWYYLPTALLINTYLGLSRDKEIHHAALSLGCDDEALKLLLKSLPSWVDSNGHERCYWLNLILKKLWPSFSMALANMIQGIVNPILADVCKTAPILRELRISEISFGYIPPYIQSVIMEPNNEGMVRLDLEIYWPSEIFAILIVKLLGSPVHLKIELKKVSLKARIRVELLRLTSMGLACFEELSVSFVGEPKLEFTLKLASLDVMNIGISKNYSVTKEIEKLLISILKDIMVYPNAIRIPMYPEDVLSQHHVDQPKALIIISDLKCKDLTIADWAMTHAGSSDPYIVVKLFHNAAGEQKTSIKHKNLNPVYDEVFEFLTSNKENEMIQFAVFDHDDLSSDDPLGYCKLSIEEAKAHRGHLEPLALYETDTYEKETKGHLYVNIRYIPLVTEHDDSDSMDDLLRPSELRSSNPREDMLDIATNNNNNAATTPLSPFRPPPLNLSNNSSNSSYDVSICLFNISNLCCYNLKLEPKTQSFLKSNHKSIRAFIAIKILSFDEKTNSEIVIASKRTQTALKGMENAPFAQSFSFVIKEKSPEDILVHLTVYDDRSRQTTLGLSTMKSLGDVTLPLSDLILPLDLKYKNASSEKLKLNVHPGGLQEDRFISFKYEWRVAKTHYL